MAKPPNQHFGVVEDIINKLLRVKAITFDIDGTIWDFVGAMRHSLFKALHEAHLRDPETASMLDVDIMIETRDLVHLAMREITPDLVEIRKASFRQALIDIGRPNELLAERMSEVYFDNRWAKSDLCGGGSARRHVRYDWFLPGNGSNQGTSGDRRKPCWLALDF